MKYCRDCELGDCAMRTPLGGCMLDTPWFTSQPHWTLEQAQKYREELEKLYWEKFRREAAKDLLCAVVTREAPQYSFGCRNIQLRVNEAVEWADELIRQLKEEPK